MLLVFLIVAPPQKIGLGPRGHNSRQYGMTINFVNIENWGFFYRKVCMIHEILEIQETVRPKFCTFCILCVVIR